MKYYFTIQYIKFWLILCSKSIRPAKTIHIPSLSFIARGEKQIRSVITITSKPGTRDPKVQNAKTRVRLPSNPGQSHPIPCFSSPPKMLHTYWQFLILEQCLHLTFLRKHWNGIDLLQNIFAVDITDISLSENHINKLVKCNLIYMLCFSSFAFKFNADIFQFEFKCSFQPRLEQKL